MAVSAAIAKTAVTIVSDKRGQAVIGVLICSVIMLFFLPLIVYMGVMGNMSEVQIDTVQVQQTVIQNLSAEDKETLEHIESVMTSIQTEFSNRGLGNYAIKKAQALYACALFDTEKNDSDFITKYADCFEKSNSDDELRAAILSAFGVSIDTDKFNNLMSVIKNTVIDISGLSTEKNNLDLVKWAEYAYENKWGYVYGSYCNVLTESELSRLISVFGSNVSEKEEYIRSYWLGRRTADCVGLIKGYGWYDNTSGTIKYGTNGMKDVTADGMYAAATEKGTIDTMPDIPGLAVWYEGHIGVYIGNGYVIQAANTYDGVIKTAITSSGWTHWLKIPYINYVENEE